MAKVTLLTDFGSTYTKLTAVDLDSERTVGFARVPTTVRTGLPDGLSDGLSELKKQGVTTIAARLACSSAAGGLKMAVSGLMPELTVEAARRAALGAGAKVWRVYSHELTRADIAELNAAPPDIFLLTGGTDGGNKANILKNAGMLSRHAARPFPVVLAGNRAAADEAADLLRAFSPVVCPNVMPTLGVLAAEPVQAAIRTIFLKHIVRAKGLQDVASELNAPLIPTPSAVLAGMTLLADGTDALPGLGGSAGVDIGGATTDVYSICTGDPSEANITLRGLPEPYAKRTVEGDIGLRFSCRGIVSAAGEADIMRHSGLSAEALQTGLSQRENDPGWLAAAGSDLQLDKTLAYFALAIALRRHAGQLESVYTPLGQTFVQTGKDLRPLRHVLLTGGPLIAWHDAGALLAAALRDPGSSLLPRSPAVLLDREYRFSALGLLATWQPDVALRMMLKEFSYE